MTDNSPPAIPARPPRPSKRSFTTYAQAARYARRPDVLGKVEPGKRGPPDQDRPNGPVLTWAVKPLTGKARQAMAEEVEALSRLRRDYKLRPGTTLHTVLRSVSSSGMSRHIGVVLVRGGKRYDLTGLVGKATGHRLNKGRDGLVVGGCGMDMGFHLVYGLSRRLFPDGFTQPKKGRTARYGEPGTRNQDGGYALNQRWM